jgi:glutaredoxin 3
MPAVKIYSKLSCPYCVRAKMLLNQHGVLDIEDIRLDIHPEKRDEMIAATGRYTVPQIFIGDIHIGGCDDLFALDQQGKLTAMLQA